MQAPQLNFRPKGLYIGGKWVDSAGGKSFESVNPSNREKLADLPLADERDVDRAVTAAKAAFTPTGRGYRRGNALARSNDSRAASTSTPKSSRSWTVSIPATPLPACAAT